MCCSSVLRWEEVQKTTCHTKCINRRSSKVLKLRNRLCIPGRILGQTNTPVVWSRPTVDISGLICRIFTCRQTELPDFINALQEVRMNSMRVHCVCMFLPQIWNDPMLLWPLTHSASSLLLLRIYLLPMQEHSQICRFQIRVASHLIKWQRLFSSMFFFFALHTTGWLHVTKITVKNPHAQSFQLLNNTKQTLTYFQSREQAPENTRSGIHPGSGSREEQSVVHPLQLLVHGGIQWKEGRGLLRLNAWCNMWALESRSCGLRIHLRVFQLPVNVIKAAGTKPPSWRPRNVVPEMGPHVSNHQSEQLSCIPVNFYL